MAERIRESLQTPLTMAGHEISMSTSIGIALSTSEYSSPDDLLRAADTAMYWAKHTGRAHYEVFDVSMNTFAIERLGLETDLRRAIKRQEFMVHYQPKVELATGRIVGMEALVRWQHSVHGLLTPAQFIPLAEETVLILPLGQWVLETACRQVKVWQERYKSGLSLMLSVNLSVRQFQHGSLVDEVARILGNWFGCKQFGVGNHGKCGHVRCGIEYHNASETQRPRHTACHR
jgi:predicted signal transduction protein with EAL and GGDEF domain